MSQATLHYEQGKLCYQNKRFNDAIFQFQEAIRLQPADASQQTARCYNARGVVYFYLGEFRKVIKDCTKAIELDPNNANYYNCRGNAFFSLGKFSKAAEDFSKAIDLSPQASHGRYYNNRGSAYRRLKTFREAVKDYTSAIAVDPKNGNYYNNRGNTYFDMGEFQMAIDDFTTALGLEPYSPKTKLTLAQAHEALAQEKRMKNATEFTGTYSHPKSKQVGKRVVSVRKDRENVNIYVSPAGVEVAFTHGWRKKRATQSFAWSEDMKIELVDDQSVKLFLDAKRQVYVVITPCDATAVEEELISRITTKYASYSTACLVAQHEGVVQEYTGIVSSIRQAQDAIALLDTVMDEAERQKDEFVKSDKFDQANQSKAQIANLDSIKKAKLEFIEAEKRRAESVRQKALQEAGAVLDMVLIMQNRVEELYKTKVRNASDKYATDDLELSTQCEKMEALVVRARELGHVVERPVQEIEDAMERAARVDSDDDDDDSDDDEIYENAAAAAAATQSGGGGGGDDGADDAGASGAGGDDEDDEDDESDWDDIDESALPAAYAPSGGEVFMTVESANGMVTITPSRGGGNADDQLVMVKKGSLVGLTSATAATPEELAELKTKAEAAEKEKEERERAVQSLEATSAELQQVRQEMEALKAGSGDAGELAALKERADKLERAAGEKDAAVASLKATQEELENMRDEKTRLKAELAQKQAELESNQSDLSGRLQMTAKEKEDLEAETERQEAAVRELQAQLQRQGEEMHAAASSALQTARRVKELEEAEQRYQATLADLREQSEEQKAEVERQKQQLAEQLEQLEGASKDMLDDLEGVRAENEELTATVSEQSQTLAELRKHLASVQSQLSKAAAEAQDKASQLEREREAQKHKEEEISALKAAAQAEEQKRRELHNIIQEIKGNIRVYVRIRPANAEQKQEIYQPVVGSDDRGLTVIGEDVKSLKGGRSKKQTWNFEFDRIFWPRHQQTDVFKEISQLVQSALDGYKVSIFAYGQTGSGKTHTMEGPDAADENLRGCIPRSVDQIFSYAAEMNKKGWEYQVEATYLEIYNTEIRDLLGDGKGKHEIKLQKVSKNETETVVTDLTSVPVTSSADVAPLIAKAKKARTSASTKMNDVSSRSHSVFTLRLKGVNKEAGHESKGVLNLIDLAGSERVDKSGAQGQRFEEAKAINSSLTCLGDVIAAMAKNDAHVPFRNSKLTYLLQPCFGSGSKTLMFVNLANEASNLQETLCSLRFGAKVHETHIGRAKKQVKGTKKKR